MTNNPTEVLIEEFKTSLRELIECYSGVQPELHTELLTGIESAQAASVGFGDQHFRGSAVLLAESTTAKQLGAGDEDDVSDWLGELGNQLVGRFKNKIAEYGVLMNMGLPVTMCGKDLHVDGETDGHWYVKWSGCYVTAVLKLEVDECLNLVRDPELAVAEEGSISLF